MAATEIALSWQEGAAFVAESAGGHRTVFDGSPEIGGKNKGMRPMEGMLSAIAACSAMDAVNILKKSRQPLRAFKVEVKATRAADIPAVFTDIHLHFSLRGELSAAAVSRAVSLSVEKYCSALASLSPDVKIRHSHSIQNEADGDSGLGAAE